MSKANTAWQQIHRELAGSQQCFVAQLQDTEAVQNKQLLTILKKNAKTEFGQKYQFSTINSIRDYIQRVPIHSYEDCRPYLETMANDPLADIICFEETGGSTQGSKLIPYTQHSFNSFQNALFPWLDDLLNHRPGIKSGTAYWSISPSMQKKRLTKGGHPIGLSNDALYFGDFLAHEISQTLAVSPKVAEINNLSDWRYQTLRDLLLAEDLSYISVWSPTFLLELIQYLPTIVETLLDDIQRKNSHRASFLKSVIKQGCAIPDTKIIWPELDTISCWTDGSASSFIPEMQVLFPHAFIQGKGLLATEGVMTIPVNKAKAPVLAVASGFYEFMDEHGHFKLAHELKKNEIYGILLTNDSGLYRYNLGDKVCVEGYFHSAPELSFVGRGEHYSDLCGEKLSDDFVVTTFSKFKTLNGFRYLYPAMSPQPHYVLVTDINVEIDLNQLDKALCGNPQYQYARKMGQLGFLQYKVVPDIMQRYTQWQYLQGRSIGDLKPPSLITDNNLIRTFHEPF